MVHARLPDGFLDELKARLRPSDVIGRKVKLVRRGKEWVGLSPFTNEKTPSFYVNDQKGIFKDFSSGLGGDVIKFLMETERLEFMEAVERLADEAGMELPKASPAEMQVYDRLKRLKEACAAAQGFFREKLASQDGAEARSYLQDKRGLPPKAWERWGIGFAPADWRQLFTHLRQEGFTVEEITGAGLAKTSEKGGEPYDVFRNRIMFPIEDVRGDVIAFGGRALDPEDKAKYLNSPETDLFHKSRILYNYKHAREALGYGERGGLIVCEGYMDVIAMGEAGFETAVAPLGTALTPDQLTLLWRAGPDPIMCFDGDSAGLRAAHRAVDVALPEVQPDRSVFFVFLPEKLDPDDLLKQEGGRGRMTDLLEAKRPLVDVVWSREREAEPLDTPERKAGLEARLKACAAKIQHEGVRQAYQRDLLSRMKEHFWQQRGARKAGKAAMQASALKAKAGPPPALGQLVGAAASPELLDAHAELLASAELRHPISNAICDAIMTVYCDTGTVTRDTVSRALAEAGDTSVRDAFDAYPAVAPIELGGQQAREWELLIRLYLTARTSVEVGKTGRDEDLSDPDAWARLHREIAERQRLRAESSDAQMAAHEVVKKRLNQAGLGQD
ncbi:MAG: DNA primase [Hyphomonadaceae bacterium]|nr:DNA primase [Hyphomonadaceae bacterium]